MKFVVAIQVDHYQPRVLQKQLKNVLCVLLNVFLILIILSITVVQASHIQQLQQLQQPQHPHQDQTPASHLWPEFIFKMEKQ